MLKSISITEAKARLAEVVDEVTDSRDTVVISRYGAPTAVMMSIDAYESLIETMEILADPETVAAIREAEEEMIALKFLTHEDVWREAGD